MPTWSSLQSLIQLGVAINAAIFSIAALRGPLVARETEARNALDRRHDLMLADANAMKSPGWKPFHSSYLSARAAFVESEASIDRGDRRIQWVAGAAALACVVALVLSAYQAGDSLGPLGVAVLVVLAVGPSLLAIVFNGYVVSRKLDRVRQLRVTAEGHLLDLQSGLEADKTARSPGA
jgi:hypothetical protein